MTISLIGEKSLNELFSRLPEEKQKEYKKINMQLVKPEKDSKQENVRPLIITHDNIFNQVTKKIDKGLTAFSVFNHQMVNGPQPEDHVELYVRRNTLLSAFRTRVQFLFEVVEDSVNNDIREAFIKRGVSLDVLFGINMNILSMYDFYFLNDLFMFNNLVTSSVAASDVANNMSLKLYERLYGLVKSVTTQWKRRVNLKGEDMNENTENIDVYGLFEDIFAISLMYKQNVHSTLLYIINEINTVYMPAALSEEMPELCGPEKDIDFAKDLYNQ